MNEYTVTYAQNREDIILKGFFKHVKKGFFVDVGAFHPTADSVTKIFYDQGWRGINIEPNPTLHKLFKSSRPRDINLQIGISDKAGKLVLREYTEGKGLSTFSKDMQESYAKHPNMFTKKYKEYEVRVMPLREILEKYDVPAINFMKIDVEGYEYNAIASNDWNRFRPQVLCIEANHIIKDWRPILERHGYELVFFDGLNNYYVAKEHPKIKASFSYPEALLGKPAIPEKFFERIKAIVQLQEQTEQKLAQQVLVVESLKAEIHNLHAQYAANRRLRTQVRQLAADLNAAIILRIEKLNKPKDKQQKPIVFTQETNQEDLLVQIKQYDLERYYQSKATHPVIYSIINTSYAGLYKGLQFVARKLFRIARRLKNG